MISLPVRKIATRGSKGNNAQRRGLRAAWRLIRLYWTSGEKWSAWALLLTILALNLGTVYTSVQINQWNYHFYNALQAFQSSDLLRQLGVFCVLVALAIAMSVCAIYFKQMLQIRWRAWLTDRFLTRWSANGAYYQLELDSATTDNPDQRIAEDLDRFTMIFLNLFFGLVSSVVSVASFLIILWTLSGSADIPLGKWQTIHIPAYLLWAALIYSAIGTWLTTKIGRSLVPLNYLHQRYEADFRFSLVRLRENAEGIAFYRGEPVELRHLRERFGNVARNVRQIMKRQRSLTGFTMGYNQVAVVFPLMVVSPRYFARQIGWGGLMQVVNAFAYVQTSLSFIVNSYSDIALWQSAAERLGNFEDDLQTIHEFADEKDQVAVSRRGHGLAVSNVSVHLPDGTPLLRDVTFSVAPEESLLITGPSGSGKSTLLRAIAGIWPFATGTVNLTRGAVLFVPQRSYLPLGTLADALRYPAATAATLPRARLVEVLNAVGLGALTDELEVTDNWARRLSLGEQQRLAFARVFLSKPTLLFLDEATSALDESAEADLLCCLLQSAWRPTLVSIGHRKTLIELHDRSLDISRFQAIPEELPELLSSATEPAWAPAPRTGKSFRGRNGLRQVISEG